MAATVLRDTHMLTGFKKPFRGVSLETAKVVQIAWFGKFWFRNGVGSEEMVQIFGSKLQDFSVHFRACPEEDHACDSKVFGQPEAASSPPRPKSE